MNGKNTAVFSKKSDMWETPDWLFELLDDEFDFDCDAAATLENSKCDIMITKETDALSHHDWCGYVNGEDADTWVETFFLNPPYSKIAAFMKKAYEESLKGAVVVCLIPCRTDTRYWDDYVMKAHEIRLIKGRLKFVNKSLPSYRKDRNFKISPAPFPSCIVIFDHNNYDKNDDPTFKMLLQPPKRKD